MNCRLSSFGIKILSNKILQFLKNLDISSKKLLILDCDNTIWGGVLGEEGINKIQIGQDGIGKAFYDFQKVVKSLKERGILIALASKNNLSDVKKVLRNHKSMILKENDITIFKVNWKDKSSNIMEISKDLMLGLDSFVFWDDNPIERQKVKKNLKHVDVIEPNKDVSEWPKQLLEFSGFAKVNVSREDKVKTDQYKKRSEFIERKNLVKDEIKYLKSIKIKPNILNLNSSNIDRAVQMTQKTNQFNFTTKRYNHKKLLEINKKNKVFLVKLTDIYGDHGIISLVILKLKKNIIYVDTLLLSCRILGRYLENWILKKIQDYSKKCKAKFTIINCNHMGVILVTNGNGLLIIPGMTSRLPFSIDLTAISATLFAGTDEIFSILLSFIPATSWKPVITYPGHNAVTETPLFLSSLCNALE